MNEAPPSSSDFISLADEERADAAIAVIRELHAMWQREQLARPGA